MTNSIGFETIPLTIGKRCHILEFAFLDFIEYVRRVESFKKHVKINTYSYSITQKSETYGSKVQTKFQHVQKNFWTYAPQKDNFL